MSILAACDLLILDCDGVLVDSEHLSIKATVEVLRGAGIPATLPMIQKHFGMKMADTLWRLPEETGHAIPAAAVEGIWPVTRAIFEVELCATPGIEAFLDATDAVRRCVASSSDPERIAVSLGLVGLAPRFGANLFSSSQVSRGKPAPDLFLLAADRMGADPGRCIVIEDSVHGVKAARAAGMTPFGYAGGGHIAPGHERLLTAAGAEDVAADWDGMLRRFGGLREPPDSRKGRETTIKKDEHVGRENQVGRPHRGGDRLRKRDRRGLRHGAAGRGCSHRDPRCQRPHISDAEQRLAGKNITFGKLDVTDPDAVEAMAARLTERLGRIGILVNSAGIGRQTAAEDITPAEWREVIDINLSGTFYTAQAFGKRMLDGKGGVIVNIGSMAGDIVVRPQKNVHYNASKAAVHHLTKSMAAEWAPMRVRVNAVAPGFIETPMNAFALKSDVETTNMWLGNTPLGRVGQTDEIASVVAFLCSDASSLMTGAIVAADAGYTLW